MENRKENFSQWYNEIIETAGMLDKRYPVKGMNIWMPYGLKISQQLDMFIRKFCDSSGINEVSFPLLITRGQLAVEFEHLKGFEGQVFWVTKGGTEQLEEDMSLRPTSESAMYPMFSLWIRTHGDLPLKIYQIVNVYRYETKHTRAFLRDREIHFFEAHTAHESFEDAEKEIEEYLAIWKEVARVMCVPYVIHRRPEWDKFPGARYSNAVDTVMPSGRTLQLATLHQYAENFSKPYEITYSDESGERKFVHQTTYGMSSRLIGAMVGIHGDDKGLILPPDLAPVQVVIVPIPSGTDTISYAKKIYELILASGVRVKLDDRDSYTPGYKYNDWEMRGVPIRIEIGEREVGSSSVTLVLRTEKGKKKIESSKLLDAINESLNLIREHMTAKAIEQLGSMLKDSPSLDDMVKWNGASQAAWCGKKECADEIEAKTEKICLGYRLDIEKSGKCIVCGDQGKLATFSRTY